MRVRTLAFWLQNNFIDNIEVGGLPLPNINHAESVAQMALDMQGAIAHFQAKYNEPLQ